MDMRSGVATRPINSPAWLLIILCLAAVSSVLDRFLLSILVQPIQTELHLSDVQMGLLQGIAFALFYALLGLPLAHFADRSNRRTLIATGLLLWSVATAAGGLATGFATLFLARMMVGIGEAALNPAAYSLLAQSFDKTRLARAIGTFQSALQLATGLSIVIGGGLYAFLAARADPTGLVAGIAPWRLTMMLVAIPGALLAALMLLTVREPPRAQPAASHRDSVKTVWRALTARRCMLLIVILGYCPMAVSGYGLLSWFPTHLIRTFGFTAAQAGTAFGSTAAISGLIGCLVGGVFADALYRRFGTLAPLVVLVGACAGAMTTIAAPLMPGPVTGLAVFAIGNMLFAMSNPLVATLIQLNAPADVRARVSGVWVCLFNLAGFGLGPLLVASLTEHVFHRPELIRYGLAMNSAIMLSLALVTLLAALIVSRRTADPQHADDASAFQ